MYAFMRKGNATGKYKASKKNPKWKFDKRGKPYSHATLSADPTAGHSFASSTLH